MNIRAHLGRHSLNAFTLRYPYSALEDPERGYDFFKNEYGRILKYQMNNRKNHAVFITGESQSGKTTSQISLCKNELKRGTKILYGNIKDEKINFKEGKKLEVSDLRLHESHIYKHDIVNLSNIYGVDKGRLSDFSTAKNLLKRKGIIIPDVKDSMEDDWFANSGLIYENMFEEHGDCIIIDGRKDPERFGVIFSNICRQILVKRKAGMKPKYRLLIAIDEAGDPDFGLVRKRAPSEIRSSVVGLATAGAVHNVLMVFNTQYPQHMIPVVIQNCPHRIIHAMWYEAPVKKIATSVGKPFGYINRILPHLDKGECLFSARGILEKRYVMRA